MEQDKSTEKGRVGIDTADVDAAIIDLYYRREEAAIQETARHYGPLCLRVAMNILENRADADECVNDTYLKAWNSIPPARPSRLSAFLARITRNLAIDRYRAYHRDKRDSYLTVMLSELEECIPSPEENNASALLAHIKDFLRAQSDLDRKLFIGRYFHAYEVKKMAACYGLTANAVSLRLHKIREKLRIYLQERGYRI